MNTKTLAPICLFVGGIALISVAAATGEAEVSLFLVFPVISGSGALFLIGTVLILFSFIVGFAFLARGQHELATSSAPWAAGVRTSDKLRTRTEYGGVVLVGPIPIAFGSSRNIAWMMLAIGIAVAVLILLLVFLSL